MKLHLGEKFQCKVCKKQYTSARGLKEHIVFKHDQISKFKCELCGKAFAKQIHLDVHNSTHLKPLRCKVCQQGYKTEVSLKNHYEKVHRTF